MIILVQSSVHAWVISRLGFEIADAIIVFVCAASHFYLILNN